MHDADDSVPARRSMRIWFSARNAVRPWPGRFESYNYQFVVYNKMCVRAQKHDPHNVCTSVINVLVDSKYSFIWVCVCLLFLDFVFV